MEFLIGNLSTVKSLDKNGICIRKDETGSFVIFYKNKCWIQTFNDLETAQKWCEHKNGTKSVICKIEPTQETEEAWQNILRQVKDINPRLALELKAGTIVAELDNLLVIGFPYNAKFSREILDKKENEETVQKIIKKQLFVLEYPNAFKVRKKLKELFLGKELHEFYDVYLYEYFDDNDSIFISLESAISHIHCLGGVDSANDLEIRAEAKVLYSELRNLFEGAGYDGTPREPETDIQAIFLPPFAFSYEDGTGDGYCNLLFHVKQDNNGTSFVALPKNIKVMFNDCYYDTSYNSIDYEKIRKFNPFGSNEQEDFCGSPIENIFWERVQRQKKMLESLVPQFPIKNYRVDFAIPEMKIAIELDGHDYHKTKQQRTNDAKRERELQELGWKVIRFTGTEIYQNIENCLRQLFRIVK